MKHKGYKVIASAALLVAFGQAASGQTARKLTMDEAVKLSLQNSKQLKLSAARVDEAVANYRNEWNNHLPDVKVSGSYLRLDNPTVDLKVKLGGSSTDTSAHAGSRSPLKVNQAVYGIANANLTLFSGFRIKYGVESARYLEQAARLDAENDKEDIALNATNAYTNLYKSKKSVELVEENLREQKQRVTDFSNLEKNGLLARNDLLKAELQQSNMELTLLDAQSNLSIATINMDLMLGLPEDTQLAPDEAGFGLPGDAGTETGWELAALHNRKDISSLTYREKAAEATIRSTKGEYYPGIALTGGYIAADIPNLLTITNAVNIGIGVQYNLGSLWKTGAKVEQAQARMQQITARQDMLTDEVRLQISQAYQSYLLSLKKIDVYGRAIEQANENYRITRNKYDNSLATTTDLLEADVAQLQAKLNHSFSQADALVAYKKLQQTAGMLIENNKPGK
jgi:outer membrane protein